MIKHQPEFQLQKAICRWLDAQYPKVLYLSDTVASVQLTFPQQNRNKMIQKSGFKTPDLIIFEPNNYYHGLFIELKSETPFKKDGTLRKDEHLEAQQKTINDLKDKGYYACFAWDLSQIMNIINLYMDYCL